MKRQSDTGHGTKQAVVLFPYRIQTVCLGMVMTKSPPHRSAGRVSTGRKSAGRKASPRRFADKRWSARVTRESDALDLEAGVFTWRDPRRIAASLKRSAERSRRRESDPYRSALSMLTIAPAGSSLPPGARSCSARRSSCASSSASKKARPRLAQRRELSRNGRGANRLHACVARDDTC